MRAPTISLRNITRRFGPVVANDDVSLDLPAGRIHALVGENGAGKTTLMRVLYGLLIPDAGRIEVDGRVVSLHRPADAMRLGLGMVHQHFMLVDPLTVAENVCLGCEPGRFGAMDRAGAEREVAERSARHGLPVDPKAKASALSVGEQQRVEILKALYHGARVLILDEPTAVLTPQEVDDLFRVLRELKRDGASIVLITHKLTEVKAIADEVTVMRAGRVVGGGPAQQLSIERIAELMVGRPVIPRVSRAAPAVVPGVPRVAPAEQKAQAPPDVVPGVSRVAPAEQTSEAPPSRVAPAEQKAQAPQLLRVRELSVRDDRGLEAVRGVSLTVHGGEIVGLAGVEGNGQHELIEALAGLRRASRGSIAIAGTPVTGRGAASHTRAGLAHIPSDRLRRGLVPPFTLAENLLLGRQREPGLGAGALWSPRALATRARELLEEFDVRPPDPRLRASQLSGGNQQKLIAARELTRGAQVVLAAHPTRGVDLLAVEFIHRRLLAERDAGHAVLLVSSELSEILALSDRILVMYGGSIAYETLAAQTDERTLGQYMTGKTSA